MRFTTTSNFKYVIVLISSLALSVFASTSHISVPALSRSQECPIRFPYQLPVRFSARRIDTETTSRKDKLTRIGQSRISNGDFSDFHYETENELADYMAALFEYDVRFRNSTFGNGIPFKVCSAAVVSPTLLVSSASCAIGKKFALVGADELLNNNPFNRSIARVIPDPRFDFTDFFKTMKYDFAFVELNTALPGRVKQMRVSGEATLPTRDTFTRTAGYGNMYIDGGEFSYNSILLLLQLDMPTFDDTICQRRYNAELGVELSVDINSQICIGYMNRSKQCHLCEGDLGGPLIQYDYNGLPVLVGVSSYNGQIFGFPNTVCKLRNIPTIFTRSGQYIEDFNDYGLDIVRSSDVEVFKNWNVSPSPSPSPTPTKEQELQTMSPSKTPAILETERPSNTPLMNPSEMPSISPSPKEKVDGGGISGGVIGGIVGGSLGFLLIVFIVYLVWRNFSKDESSSETQENDQTTLKSAHSYPPEVDVHSPTVRTFEPVQQPDPVVTPITHPTPPTIISLS